MDVRAEAEGLMEEDNEYEYDLLAKIREIAALDDMLALNALLSS